MPREKRLNILNTNRHFNINLMRSKDIEDKIKIHRLNEKDIESDMDALQQKSRHISLRDAKEYIIYQEKYTNDRLIRKVISHGGGVTYYTDSVVPYYVLKQLANHTNSEVVYSIKKEFTDREKENIELSFMATKVIIDCPMVIPDMSPYDLLFALHDLKTNVDKVQLSFPPLTEIAERHKEYYEERDGKYHVKPNYKYSFFKYIQHSLSLWKMNIWLVSSDEKDHVELDRIITKARNKRSPKKKKGAKVNA